ncbi:hypothetical protein ACFRCG_33665 [Embleya sp. NPDC056575]|uniref:hypothetical protein n=1 Tax=unclassified Embleya TaxID=2699296 RepID=UPI0036BFB7BF
MTFDLIRCTGCGVQRVRGVPCADCGRTPPRWEINHNSAGRRAAAEAAVRVYDEPARAVSVARFAWEDFDLLCGRLEAWLRGFFRTMQAVARNELGSAERLADAVRTILAERALLAAAPRHRPYIGSVDAADATVDLLARMVRSYLDTLRADTPLKAQRHADAAQRLIDEGEERLARFRLLQHQLVSVMSVERSEEQLAALLQQASVDLGVKTLSQLIIAGEQMVEGLTGDAPGRDCGIGLHFAMYDTAMRLLGDQARFRRLVADSYALFAGNPGVLSAIAAEPDFLPDLKGALLDLTDAAGQATYVARTSTIPRQLGSALADVAASQVEGPGRLSAIALLVVTGRKTRPYDKLRHDNGTTLLGNARDHADLAPLLTGFNPRLRTARSHGGMLRYTDTGVTLLDKHGPSEIAWPELADGILTACESSLGCLVGLLQALSRLGVSFGDKDDYLALGITPAGMVAAVLGGQGCADIDVFADEPTNTWHITALAPTGSELTSLLVGAAAHIPDTVERVVFTAERDGEIHELTGPAALLRLVPADNTGLEDGRALMRMLRAWRHNGEPLIDTASLRRWAAIQSLACLGQDANPIPRLRALRTLAHNTGDPELAHELTAAIRNHRLGHDKNASAPGALDRLLAWADGAFTLRVV